MGKQKTIVEEVMGEKNFSTGAENIPAPNIPVDKILSDSYVGNVRIEGEVTPEKLQLARDFEMMFTQAADEVMSLAAYKPKDDVLELVKSGKVDEARVAQMKAAPPWTAFQVGTKLLMKTPDNKLEEVKAYCFRLERAVLSQVQINKQKEDAHKNAMNFLQEQLDATLKQNKAYQEYVGNLKNKVQTKFPQIFKDEKPRAGRPSLWLSIKPYSTRIKNALLKILCEETNNG